MNQIGVQTKGIAEGSHIESGLELIARAGFDCIDLNLDAYLPNYVLYEGKTGRFFDQSLEELEEYFSDYHKILTSYGLLASQMHAPYPVMIHGREKQNQYMMREVIPKSLWIAGFLEIPFVVIHPWKLQYITSREDEQRKNLEYFTSLIPLAKKNHLTICLENLYEGAGQHLIEGVCADVKEAVWLVDELNSRAGQECFGFCLDTGHLNLTSQDPNKWINILGNRLKILHLHDNDGRGDLHQLPFSFQNADGPGKGVDWERVLKGLRDIKYQGVLNFETFPCLTSFPESMPLKILKTIREIGMYFADRLQQED